MVDINISFFPNFDLASQSGRTRDTHHTFYRSTAFLSYKSSVKFISISKRNFTMGSAAPADITLYTSHGCPWAHRAHIALAELGIPFKEEIIDLSTPRTPEYLKINPRGLVPSISYNGEIITESAIVSQFLIDKYPSHLLKRSDEEGGPLQRARINFFVDAYFSKVNSGFYPILKAQGADKEVEINKFVAAIVKELEPLLQDASPFFGGSSKLTLAEVAFLPSRFSAECSEKLTSKGLNWLIRHPSFDISQV
jgi:glutathione S-transferase